LRVKRRETILNENNLKEMKSFKFRILIKYGCIDDKSNATIVPKEIIIPANIQQGDNVDGTIANALNRSSTV